MPPTVVIVDDNEGYRNSSRDFLESDGFDVVAEANAGSSAIGLVMGVSPSLVLLDVRHDMSGFVADRLRSKGYDRPVVVVSSRRAPASTSRQSA